MKVKLLSTKQEIKKQKENNRKEKSIFMVLKVSKNIILLIKLLHSTSTVLFSLLSASLKNIFFQNYLIKEKIILKLCPIILRRSNRKQKRKINDTGAYILKIK